MAFANDSIAWTPPGSGTTLATHLKNSKEHHVHVGAWETGQLVGTEPLYLFSTGIQNIPATSGYCYWDLFNADASAVVRVLAVYMQHFLELTTSGSNHELQMFRTTAVGTGGTALTAWLPDSTDAALDADITCRADPTGGATTSTSLRWAATGMDDGARTIPSHDALTRMPLNFLPWPSRRPFATPKGIVLRQNQGIRMDNYSPSTTDADISFVIAFTVE